MLQIDRDGKRGCVKTGSCAFCLTKIKSLSWELLCEAGTQQHAGRDENKGSSSFHPPRLSQSAATAGLCLRMSVRSNLQLSVGGKDNVRGVRDHVHLWAAECFKTLKERTERDTLLIWQNSPTKPVDDIDDDNATQYYVEVWNPRPGGNIHRLSSLTPHSECPNTWCVFTPFTQIKRQSRSHLDFIDGGRYWHHNDLFIILMACRFDRSTPKNPFPNFLFFS